MSEKQVKRYRHIINKYFSENETAFAKLFMRTACKWELRSRIKTCFIILFKRSKWIAMALLIFFSACELQSTDKNNYDHTAEYLNTRCDLDGEFRSYPADNGGYCMECQFGMWKKIDCADFAGCH